MGLDFIVRIKQILQVIISILILNVLFTSCRPNSIEQLSQLKKHYKSNEDSLKLKAAKFLLEGQSSKIHLSSNNSPGLFKYFSTSDSLKMFYPNGLPRKIKQNLVDSLKKLYPNVLYDVKWEQDRNLDTQYLINNIDQAFEAWKSSPWKSSISFELFCEYVLPYNIRKEIPENWRESLNGSMKQLIDSLPHLKNDTIFYAYHRKNSYKEIRSFQPFKELFPYSQNLSQLNSSRTGSCIDQCSYVIYHLRAAGLPATLDYIPHWGNRANNHYMVGLANHLQQLYPLPSNKNTQDLSPRAENKANQGHLNPIPKKNEFPKKLNIQYIKTIPKVYRYTWSNQKKQLSLYNQIPKSELYNPLAQPNLIDVTDQYTQTSDIMIEIPDNTKQQLAYLAVFDITGWKPVAAQKININGKVKFKKMGRNVLYLPVFLNKNQSIPFDSPFFISENGNKIDFKTDHNDPINMNLIRKYPFFSYTAEKVLGWKETSFQASNDKNFKNYTTLADIDFYPFYWESVECPLLKPFRFVRFKPNPNRKTHIGEIEFYGLNEIGDTIKLDSRIHEGSRTEKQKVIDGDMSSYYICNNEDDYIVFDLGEDNVIPIVKIKFCPRNDTNSIIKGLTYELLFWDQKWQSAGIQKAVGSSLNFGNIPSNTIYWLKCLDGGKEERIFTYNDGQQIWW